MAYIEPYYREIVRLTAHTLIESKKPKLSEKKIQKLINLRGGR